MTTVNYATAPTLMRLRPSDTVRAARLLISDPYLWTQNARARDISGRRCAANHPDASSWSLNGALAVVSNPFGITPKWLLSALDQLVQELGFSTVLWEGPPALHTTCDDFNDEHNHADVMNLLDTAYTWLREHNY